MSYKRLQVCEPLEAQVSAGCMPVWFQPVHTADQTTFRFPDLSKS
jgi:hypothetical protein